MIISPNPTPARRTAQRQDNDLYLCSPPLRQRPVPVRPSGSLISDRNQRPQAIFGQATSTRMGRPLERTEAAPTTFILTSRCQQGHQALIAFPPSVSGPLYGWSGPSFIPGQSVFPGTVSQSFQSFWTALKRRPPLVSRVFVEVETPCVLSHFLASEIVECFHSALQP